MKKRDPPIPSPSHTHIYALTYLFFLYSQMKDYALLVRQRFTFAECQIISQIMIHNFVWMNNNAQIDIIQHGK